MSNEHLRRSRRQEDRLAETFDGTRNSGSGNGWIFKNDVRSPRYSIEAKTTLAKQYTLKLKDLLTAERNALQSGRDMLFALEMGARNWLIMAEEVFLEPSDGDSSSASPSALQAPTGPATATAVAKPSAETPPSPAGTGTGTPTTSGSTTPKLPRTTATESTTSVCARCGNSVSPSP